jgi:hypothetical protein
METIYPPIINQYRNQREIKKTDTQILTQRKQRETIPKNPTEEHKNNLKEEILHVINENFIAMILDMIN